MVVHQRKHLIRRGDPILQATIDKATRLRRPIIHARSGHRLLRCSSHGELRTLEQRTATAAPFGVQSAKVRCSQKSQQQLGYYKVIIIT